jgi:hypothetical protein
MGSSSLFPLATLSFERYFRSYTHRLVNPLSLVEVCSPQFAGLGAMDRARISHLPIDSNLALNALRIQQAAGLLLLCLLIIARTNLVIALVRWP